MPTVAYIVPSDVEDLSAYVEANPPGVEVDQYVEGIPRSLIGLATIEGGLLADDTPLPVVATIPDPPDPPAPPAPAPSPGAVLVEALSAVTLPTDPSAAQAVGAIRDALVAYVGRVDPSALATPSPAPTPPRRPRATR